MTWKWLEDVAGLYLLSASRERALAGPERNSWFRVFGFFVWHSEWPDGLCLDRPQRTPTPADG